MRHGRTDRRNWSILANAKNIRLCSSILGVTPLGESKYWLINDFDADLASSIVISDRNPLTSRTYRLKLAKAKSVIAITVPLEHLAMYSQVSI